MTPKARTQPVPEKATAAAEPRRPLPLPAKILLALAILVGFSFSLRLYLTPIRSIDLWFHMKAGEWIFTNHRMPPGDIFSAGFQGRDWIVNAWLADVLLWAAYHLGGDVGLLLLQIALSFLLFVGVGLAVYRLCGRPTLAVLLSFLALVASYFRFNARPELFSMLLLAALLVIVYQYKFRLSDRLFWLIPIGCLWANLHMGFTAGFGVLGCLLAGDGLMAGWYAIKRKPAPEDVIAGPRLKKLALVTAAMALATLVNPYGPSAWMFMTRLSGQFGRIAEWQPLLQVAHTIEFTSLACMAALALITACALILSLRPRDLSGFLLAGLFAASALMYSRQTAQFCVVSLFVIAAALRALPFPEPVARLGKRLTGPLATSLGVCGVLLVELTAWGILILLGIPQEVAGNPFGFGVEKTKCSDQATRFVRESGLIGGKLFNSLESGGWIIWNLWPDQTVFIDGRLDMYGLDAVENYLEIATSKDASARLKELGIDYCYFRYPQGPESVASPYHAKTLAHDPDWALVYFDDGAIIYARRNERNRAIVERYEYQVLNPLAIDGLQYQDYSKWDKQVLAEADRTMKECPDSGRAHLVSGVALLYDGHPKEAIKRLELARKFMTGWGIGLKGSLEDFLGRACLNANDSNRAVKHIHAAIALAERGENPKKRVGALRNNLGYVLFNMKRYNEAEIECQSALKLDDSVNVARVNLGRIRIARHQYKEATAWFEKALEYDPNAVSARIFEAQCLANLGDRENALLQLELAAQSNPRMVAEALADPEFKTLRNEPRFLALARPR